MEYEMMYSDDFSDFNAMITNYGRKGYKIAPIQPTMKQYYDYQVLMEKPLTQPKTKI